jgi:hypothetical protein
MDGAKRRYVRFAVSVGIGLLLVFTRLPSVHAWQLGWSTNDDNLQFGVGAYQKLSGSIPLPAGDFVSAVTGFTENDHMCFVTIGFGSANNGNDVYLAGEPCGGGMRLCGSSTNYPGTVSLGTSYFNNIYWDSTNHYWQWIPAACNNHGMMYSPGQVSDSINTAGSIDMMESTDSSHNDFTNLKAQVDFVPSLAYMDSVGAWHWSSHTVTYASTGVGNTPPTSLGVSYDCLAQHDIYISSSGTTNSTAWNFGVACA